MRTVDEHLEKSPQLVRLVLITSKIEIREVPLTGEGYSRALHSYNHNSIDIFICQKQPHHYLIDIKRYH